MTLGASVIAKNAKDELCEKEGILYKEWDKWSNLTGPATIASFGAILDKMSFPLAVPPVLVVLVFSSYWNRIGGHGVL